MAKYRKAIAGALLGGVGAAVAVLTQGGDWRAIAVAFVAGALGVGGGVAASPANRPKPAL